MTYIFCWILAHYGLTNILVTSKLLKPFRIIIDKYSDFFSALIHCIMCTGFWVGIFMSMNGFGLIQSILVMDSLYQQTASVFFDGFFGSATAWLIHVGVYNRSKDL